jgi:hypothetical protein
MLTIRVSIVVLVVVYLSLALTFSLLTRAYAADDELAHTQYIEHLVRDHSIPDIAVANGGESHQPPLYYLVAAVWQRLLGIPTFVPQATISKQIVPNRPIFNSSYSPSEHRDAVYLHELRLLSVLLGLGTVLLSYAAARVIRVSEETALASGLFVALLPRELVVSSDVTNDALAIPLCALALVLFLLAERSRTGSQPGRRRIHLLLMGLVLGAVAITKFSGLPIVVILLILSLVPSIRIPRRSGAGHLPKGGPAIGINSRALVDGFLAVGGFVVVSGWWFIRNKTLYGQFLATKRGESYLAAFLLRPVPWSAHLLFEQYPRTLLDTTWYAQPNLSLPLWADALLSAVGLVGLVLGGWAVLADDRWHSSLRQSLSGLAMLGCIVGGLGAVLLNMKTTSIGDARLLFVAIAAVAFVVTVGSVRLVRMVSPRLEQWGLVVWPVALLVADLWVVVHFLIPYGGL